MAEPSGLEGRVVAITGAAGDLGRVVAEGLAGRGARLALLGRRTGPLEELTARLGLAEDSYLVASTDFTDAGSVQAAAASVLKKFGRVDILLHLVGGYAGDRSVLDVPAEEVSGMLRQHVWTAFHAVRAFVPPMVESGWGRIVVLSQPGVSPPRGNNFAYALGKGGQELLALSLAEELRGTGVTANVILVRSIGVRDETHNDRTTPGELASTIEHLCSDEAGTINGARIPAHG